MFASSYRPPLFQPRTDELRRKIASLPSLWNQRWQRFVARARSETRTIRWYAGDSVDTPLHAVFAYLATGSEEFALIARRDLRWMLDQHAETLRVGYQDHDTWMIAAPMARRALAAQWLWDSSVLTDQDRRELADYFIRFALAYPFVVLHHRVPPHANNQGLAMALNCVIIGYIFGHLRGADPRARYLLEFALPHLIQQIAFLPPGGYSGEGSTYVVGVADPLTALACAFLEEVTGESWLERPLGRSGVTFRQILELNARLIPPSGVLPAWDQHGFQTYKAGTAACYLAARLEQPTIAAHYLFGDGWQTCDSFAWMRDDHVWQLLWMPDLGTSPRPATGFNHYPESWAEPRVAGSLIDPHGTRHLFQMWDVSGNRPVRLHMNPNSILLEAWGSLLTVDGNATEEFPLAADPRLSYLSLYQKDPKPVSFAGGSLAAHSCIWIDDKNAITVPPCAYDNPPEEVITGQLLRFERRPGLQLLATQAADFYRTSTDVTSLIRTSALIDDRFWIVRDDFAASSVHDWHWQLVLRDGASLIPHGVRLRTPEHVILDILQLDGTTPTLHAIPGYPSTLEKRCHHLRKTLRADHGAFLTVLVPRLARRELADLSEQTWTWMSENMPATNTASLGSFAAQGSGRLFDAVEFTPPQASSATADYCLRLRLRTARPPLNAGSRLLLELPRSTPTSVWINGQLVPWTDARTFYVGPRLQAPFIDITDHVGDETEFEISLRVHCAGPWKVIGGARLHTTIDVASPVWELDRDRLRLACDGWTSEFDLNALHTRTAAVSEKSSGGEDALAAASSAQNLLALTLAPEDSGDWDGDAEARQKACIAARRSTSAAEHARLIASCEDPDWNVRLAAVRIAGALRLRAAVPALLRVLAGETAARVADEAYLPRYRIKEMCMVSLDLIGDSSAWPAIAACLHENEFYGVRRLAVDILGRTGETKWIPVLERWKKDPDPETHFSAARAIARLSSSSERQYPRGYN